MASNTLPSNKARVTWIDFMRVTIIFSILLEHANDPSLIWKLTRGLSSYSVMGYFVFSGFLFKSKARFLDWRKALHFLILFISAILFASLLFTLTVGAPVIDFLKEILRPDFWINSLGINWSGGCSFGIMWFMRAIVVLTLLFPLFNRLSSLYLYLGSILMMTLGWLQILAPNINTNDWFFLFKGYAAQGMSCYLLGLAMQKQFSAKDIQILLLKHTRLAWCTLGVFALFLLMQSISDSPYFFRYKTIAYSTFLVIGYHVAICALCLRYVPFIVSFVSKWGRSCFLIFIAHWPLMIFYRQLAAQHQWDWMPYALPFCIFFTAIALYYIINLVPYCSEYICGTPHRRWVKSRK